MWEWTGGRGSDLAFHTNEEQQGQSFLSIYHLKLQI